MPLIDVITLSEKKCNKPIRAHLKYATSKNFVGRPILGYDPGITNIALMTPKAAEKLCQVQDYLIKNNGCGLLIYDAYRPKRAVEDFLNWTKQPPVNQYELERKAKHYPNIEKKEFFEKGYLVEDSGHCYGNTVDLVLVDISTGEKLDMGSRYDFMDNISQSAAAASLIGEAAYKNRQILTGVMVSFGFEPVEEEYWHFSHGGQSGREVNEPMDIAINELATNRLG